MASRLTDEQRADRLMSEAALQSRVLYRAKKYGWKAVHVQKGLVGSQGIMVTPMAKGWPDLSCFKPGHHAIFGELKRELGHPTPEQVEWLRLLGATGNHAVLIRPSDLREGRVDAMFRDGSPLQ
jgi:hypothetical protein